MVRQQPRFGLVAGRLIAILVAFASILPTQAQPASSATALLLVTPMPAPQHRLAMALAERFQEAAPSWLAIEIASPPDTPALPQVVGRAPLVILVQSCVADNCGLHLHFLPATPPTRALITPALQQMILAANPPALTYMPGQETVAVDLAIGLAAYAADRCPEGLPYLDRGADQITPASAILAFYRARCHHAVRDYAGAYDLLRASRPALLATSAPRALLALWNAAMGEASAQSFAFNRALAWDERAIRAAAGDRALLAELYLLRGQHRLYLYEWDAVLADYNMALSLLPDLPRAYYLRGLLHYTQNRLGAAYADLSRYLVLETDPASPFLPLARRYTDELARLLSTPASPS